MIGIDPIEIDLIDLIKINPTEDEVGAGARIEKEVEVGAAAATGGGPTARGIVVGAVQESGGGAIAEIAIETAGDDGKVCNIFFKIFYHELKAYRIDIMILYLQNNYGKYFIITMVIIVYLMSYKNE
jgi:hypothetical protein